MVMKILLRKLAVKFPKYSIFRRLGMWLGPYDQTEVKKATLRLLLESYFDIAIGVFSNLRAFFESTDAKDFFLFFATPADFANSVIVIILTYTIFYFPLWMYRKIYRQREDLMNPQFKEELGWLFEDLRVDNLQIALYQYYFLVRRLYFAFILTILPEYVVLQVTSFFFVSVF